MKHFLHEEMDGDDGARERLPFSSAKSSTLTDLRRCEDIARRAMTANIIAAFALVLLFLMEFAKMICVLKAAASVIAGINKLTYSSSDVSGGSS